MAPTLLESDRMQETIRVRILELQEMEARHHQLNAMIHSFSQELGFSAVSVKLYSPGFQRKLMLWPIPVVRGEI